jgi:hypothetical protein
MTGNSLIAVSFIILKGGLTMNHSKHKRISKGIAAALSFFMLMTLAFPQEPDSDACLKAFKRCMIDATLATLLGMVGGFAAGNIPGALIGTAATGGVSLVFCLTGYDFCKHYYI